MNIPEDIIYTNDHEWVKIDGEIAIIGITDYAQGELGDIVYVELPEIGTEVNQGDSFGTIEAVKAVSDLYMPLSGEVVEVNESLNDAPEKINKDPYKEGWMIKIKISDLSEKEDLLDNKQYEDLINE
jgi:glycine cleavage system H protein